MKLRSCLFVSALVLCFVGAASSASARVVKIVNLAPASAPAGANVVVTAHVFVEPEPALIRTSVTLTTTPPGGASSVLCSMVDDGTRGDLVANDNTFACQFPFVRASAQIVSFRASVAYLRELRRTLSPDGLFRVLSSDGPAASRAALSAALIAGDLNKAKTWLGEALSTELPLVSGASRLDIANALTSCSEVDSTPEYQVCVSQSGQFRFFLSPDELRRWRVFVW